MQYSIGIATEQTFRYIELIDAIIWISKMHHYVGFWQISSQIEKVDCIFYAQASEETAFTLFSPLFSFQLVSNTIHVKKILLSVGMKGLH